MPSDAALMLVNQIKAQVAGLVREVQTDLADGKLQAPESIGLAMHGMLFASTLVTALQGADPTMRRDILTVLEHGQWVMPPGA